jgi:ABC-type amino acid transport system permease subunit
VQPPSNGTLCFVLAHLACAIAVSTIVVELGFSLHRIERHETLPHVLCRRLTTCSLRNLPPLLNSTFYPLSVNNVLPNMFKRFRLSSCGFLSRFMRLTPPYLNFSL